MLKGTVTFETFKNGKLIQKESAENMVTEAVDKIMSMSPWFSDSINNKLPLAQKLLGGLFLFDGLLTEETSNIYFPRNSKLVGMGGRSTDTQDPVRGTYDDSVSGPVQNGFKSVWKFTESQAIGDIRSVSLTSVNAGTGFNLTANTSTHIDDMKKFYGTGNTGYGFVDNRLSPICWPIFYDESDQNMYYVYKGTTSPYTLTVYKRKIPLYKFGVNDGGNPGDIDITYQKESVGTLGDTNNSSSKFPNMCRIDGDYLYYWSSDTVNTTTNSYTFTGLKRLRLVSLKEQTLDIDDLGNVSFPVSFIVSGSSYNIKHTFANSCFYVSDNNITDCKIIRIPFTINNSTITIGTPVSYPSTKSQIEKTNNLYTLKNGVVLETIASTQTGAYDKYANLLYFDNLQEGSTELSSSSFVRIPVGIASSSQLDTGYRNSDIGVMRFIWNSNNLVMSIPYEEYLGTIFNLPNKVTKGDDMTMTVTYTLTNVASNSNS